MRRKVGGGSFSWSRTDGKAGIEGTLNTGCSFEDLSDISDEAGVNFEPYDFGEDDLENGPSTSAGRRGYSRRLDSRERGGLGSAHDTLGDEGFAELRDPCSAISSSPSTSSRTPSAERYWWFSSLLSSLWRRSTPLRAGPFKNVPASRPTRLTRSELCGAFSSPRPRNAEERPYRSAGSSSYCDFRSLSERSALPYSPPELRSDERFPEGETDAGDRVLLRETLIRTLRWRGAGVIKSLWWLWCSGSAL